MADCDNCTGEVGHVWRHRRPMDAMTCWREGWLCAGCHPRLREQMAQRGV